MDYLLAVVIGWCLGVLPGLKPLPKLKKAEPEPLAAPTRLEKQYGNLLNYTGSERGQMTID